MSSTNTENKHKNKIKTAYALRHDKKIEIKLHTHIV